MMRVMIDLETLGLNVPKPDCVVWQVGVTFWNEAGYNEFRFYPDVLSQIMRGRTVSQETVKWWMGQKNVPNYMLKERTSVSQMLEDISFQFERFKPEEVWANGPAFDLMILQSLAGDFSEPLPWTHKMERDVRTLRKLFGTPADDVPRETMHDTLEDNRDQIHTVNSILGRMAQNERTIKDLLEGTK